MVICKEPGVPRIPNSPSVGGGDRAATEQLVQGMVCQAAALLQLRRLPALKRLAAAQKAANAGFLQVCTDLGSKFFKFRGLGIPNLRGTPGRVPSRNCYRGRAM